MDIAVAKDLFRNLVVACTALNAHVERIGTWEALLARLPAYAVGEDGAPAEWAWPDLQNNQVRRHALYLYPAVVRGRPRAVQQRAPAAGLPAGGPATDAAA